MPSSDFFVRPERDVSRENILEPNELLVEVELPPSPPGARSRYAKIMDREAWTHAVVSVAAVLSIEEQICNDARIVLGGVAPIPWRVPESGGDAPRPESDTRAG